MYLVYITNVDISELNLTVFPIFVVQVLRRFQKSPGAELDCGHHVAEHTECSCFPGNMGFSCPSSSTADVATGRILKKKSKRFHSDQWLANWRQTSSPILADIRRLAAPKFWHTLILVILAQVTLVFSETWITAIPSCVRLWWNGSERWFKITVP